MKILGIVVLYYPDDSVEQNILSYVTNIDKLIIWENTPLSAQKNIKFSPSIEAKILRWSKGKNLGLCLPLNKAVSYGLENGYTHLLTMDQDSRFAPNMCSEFLRGIILLETVDIASFSANTHPFCNSMPASEEISISITSGTVYQMSIFREVGYFRDDFFIDGIDTEFCFRIRRFGKKMLRMNKIYMHHVLGNITVTPFLWGKLISPNYSAQRTYYLVRNSFFLKKIYPEYKQSAGLFKTILFWRSLCILFVETDKLRKFKAISIAVWHAIRSRTGEYTIH